MNVLFFVFLIVGSRARVRERVHFRRTIVLELFQTTLSKARKTSHVLTKKRAKESLSIFVVLSRSSFCKQLYPKVRKTDVLTKNEFK